MDRHSLVQIEDGRLTRWTLDEQAVNAVDSQPEEVRAKGRFLDGESQGVRRCRVGLSRNLPVSQQQGSALLLQDLRAGLQRDRRRLIGLALDVEWRRHRGDSR